MSSTPAVSDQPASDVKPPRGRLFVLSGPSGVGKSTVLKLLRDQMPSLHYSVSATTRTPRKGERDGEHYYFVDRGQFDEMTAAGQMLESALFAGNYYGTPRAEVERRLESGQDVLLEIEVQGARQVRRAEGIGSEAILLFLAPPSFEELARRLTGRGTEDAATRAARLDAARAELAAEIEFDHSVVNTDVDSATRALVELMSK